MAWTKTSVGKYIVLEESGLVLADNEDSGAEEYTVVSSVIPAVDYNFENAKFPLVCEITTASDDAVTCDAVLQVSTGSAVTGDVIGTSSATPLWADAADVDIDIVSDTLGSYSQIVDATDVYAPYARIAIKTSAADLNGGSGRVTIKLALPA